MELRLRIILSNRSPHLPDRPLPLLVIWVKGENASNGCINYTAWAIALPIRLLAQLKL
jgi:hypothetical protein